MRSGIKAVASPTDQTISLRYNKAAVFGQNCSIVWYLGRDDKKRMVTEPSY